MKSLHQVALPSERVPHLIPRGRSGSLLHFFILPRDDGLALSWSLQLHSGFATSLRDVALASFALHGFDARCTHLAARGRSGSRKLSTGCWAQSGYVTLLREVAPVQSGCHTSLQWVALHSTRLEWVHRVASEPHSNSHFAKMIIFYSLRAQMSPNTSKNFKGCSNT
ncbi:hypothetical protein F2Q69_00004743 [Brassica cretica]|uniref:Uncharacterized protein n=1 Tax=Brassica cretica TaxID=69181 RepID=A0A8S9NN10_BRACR|nr:hypothetical protein F2Q69_00004743 [Brassica cretica]